MAFRSNLQASRISRGQGWKNYWIPQKKVDYKSFLIHDFTIQSYIKTKFNLENWINKKTYAYSYDFFFEKTYEYTLLHINKYNLDYSRVSQLVYASRFNTLKHLKSKKKNTNSFLFILEPSLLNNLLTRKILFYFLISSYKRSFLNNIFLKKSNKYSELQIFNNFNLPNFIPKYIGFLEIFNKFSNFSDIFEYKYAYKKSTELSAFDIQTNSLQISSFLLNPTILLKLPNLAFFYQNWVHNSWVQSKKEILNCSSSSLVYANTDQNVLSNTNIFFCKYVKFLIYMRVLNNFFLKKPIVDRVSLNKNFLNKQQNILFLRSKISNIMLTSIKAVWSYFKTYLKLFGYENKTKIFRSKYFFKKIFFFKKILKNIIFGYSYSTASFNWFLLSNYKITFIDSLKNQKILFLILKKPKIIKFWYKYITKTFFFSLKILKKLLKFKNLNFFKKINLLRTIWHYIFKKSKFLNIKNFFFLKNLQETYLKNFSSFCFFFTLNIFFLEKKKCFIPLIKQNLHLSKKLNKKLSKKNNLLLYISKISNLVKRSPWVIIYFSNKKLLKNFYNFISLKRNKRFSSFKYFYFLISYLTPKIFFWIYQELLFSVNYNLLLHLTNIYWQNFVLFYFFVLKTLKNMYALCNKRTQLFISKPNKFFLQKSSEEIALFDYFSLSFKYFSNLMINNIFTSRSQSRNLTVGDLSFIFSKLGTPNFFSKNFYKFSSNNFSYKNNMPLSPIFIPHFSIFSNSNFFFRKKNKFSDLKKRLLNRKLPNFSSKSPFFIQVEHFSMIKVTANLLCILVKKKLEKDHMLSEILWNLSLFTSKAPSIWGFMFWLKGRFSRWERASKIFIKKGVLQNTNLWSNLDYCEIPVHLKYGTASIRVWLIVKSKTDAISSLV